jgi:SNF2 family DNA or RNA helicase
VSKISYIELNSKERQFYDAVYEASKKEFDELANHGIIEAKFMKIFEILMRLRQICCHPALFRSVTKFSNKGDFPKELRKWLDKRLEERNAGEKGSRFEILMEEDGREVRLEVGAISCNEKRF